MYEVRNESIGTLSYLPVQTLSSRSNSDHREKTFMALASPQRLAGDVIEADDSFDRRVIGGRYQVLRRLKNGDDTETLLASDLKIGRAHV